MSIEEKNLKKHQPMIFLLQAQTEDTGGESSFLHKKQPPQRNHPSRQVIPDLFCCWTPTP